MIDGTISSQLCKIVFFLLMNYKRVVMVDFCDVMMFQLIQVINEESFDHHGVIETARFAVVGRTLMSFGISNSGYQYKHLPKERRSFTVNAERGLDVPSIRTSSLSFRSGLIASRTSRGRRNSQQTEPDRRPKQPHISRPRSGPSHPAGHVAAQRRLLPDRPGEDRVQGSRLKRSVQLPSLRPGLCHPGTAHEGVAPVQRLLLAHVRGGGAAPTPSAVPRTGGSRGRRT